VPVLAPPPAEAPPPIPTLVQPPPPVFVPEPEPPPAPRVAWEPAAVGPTVDVQAGGESSVVVPEPMIPPEPLTPPEPVVAPEPPAVLPPPVQVAPPPVAPPSPTAPATGPRRPDELIYVQLAVDGGPPQRTRLKNSERLADAVGRLVDVLAAPPTDLMGGCAGWYRLAQGGQVWPGDATVAVLDPEQAVEMRFVPNRVLRATIVVPSAGARFEAPVGTAVPMRSLVGCLQRWLGLPDAPRVLYVNGRETGPLQIVEEFLPSERLELELRG
jgi:hypothetical protein